MNTIEDTYLEYFYKANLVPPRAVLVPLSVMESAKKKNLLARSGDGNWFVCGVLVIPHPTITEITFDTSSNIPITMGYATMGKMTKDKIAVVCCPYCFQSHDHADEFGEADEYGDEGQRPISVEREALCDRGRYLILVGR